MTPHRPDRTIASVVSPSEARLVFWLVVLALLTFIATGAAGTFSALAGPAIVLFVAWLMSYVLQPPVSWLQRRLPFKGRGVAVAITYFVTAIIAIVVLGAAGVALLNAAIAFVDALPAILARVRELLAPIAASLGIDAPTVEQLLSGILSALASSGDQLAAAARSAVGGLVGLVGALFTAVVISVGLAVGQVSLLGWARRFLPQSTYQDLAELELAIATSFGGFVRGRLLIGAVYGGAAAVIAVLLGIPFGPLIGMIAGLIAFIPWIGPLLGWAVVPAFAAILAPDAVVPGLILSLIVAAVIQVLVTQLVMGAAVKLSPVAVFVMVFLGASLAGVLGAVFAIPVGAAILAVTDYLRQRDVLLRAAEAPAASADLADAGEP